MLAPAALAAVVFLVTGCGSSGSGLQSITVGAARQYRIVRFQPSGPIAPGKPTAFSFEIEQPDGTPLEHFKTGPGQHTGVHLIFVRDDLATIIHHHPPLHGTALIRDTVTFSEPGVLLPDGGTWRLFLQCQADHKILTAPFTLHVK